MLLNFVMILDFQFMILYRSHAVQRRIVYTAVS